MVFLRYYLAESSDLTVQIMHKLERQSVRMRGFLLIDLLIAYFVNSIEAWIIKFSL